MRSEKEIMDKLEEINRKNNLFLKMNMKKKVIDAVSLSHTQSTLMWTLNMIETLPADTLLNMILGNEEK